MPEIVPVVLVLWVVVTIVLFGTRPARESALIALVGGWAILPTGVYPSSVFAVPIGTGGSMHALAVPTALLLNKALAIGLGCLLGVILFDWPSVQRLRPVWLDAPIVAWCLVPTVAALANGAALASGLACTRYVALAWGVPYLMGRLYLGNNESLRRLGLALVLAGLAYVPLGLLEFVHRPFLYSLIYGPHPYQVEGAVRLVGYRPLVFLEHGNQLGIWSASAAVAAVWLWWSGRLPAVTRIPGSVASAILVAACLVFQSQGALLLMLAAFALLLPMPRALWAGEKLGLTAVIVHPVPVDCSARVSRPRRLGVTEGLQPGNCERSGAGPSPASQGQETLPQELAGSGDPRRTTETLPQELAGSGDPRRTVEPRGPRSATKGTASGLVEFLRQSQLFTGPRALSLPRRAYAALAAGILLLALTAASAVVAAEGAHWSALRVKVRGVFQSIGKTSFTWRLARSEEDLTRIAERPALGWARPDWSAAPDGTFVNPVNLGFWLMALGSYGVLGMACATAVLLLPIEEVLRKLPLSAWTSAAHSAIALAALLLALNTVDSLLNSTLVLPLLAGAGGINSWSAARDPRGEREYGR